MDDSVKKGAFVISLDLELYWGVRDVIGPTSRYWENLRGERAAIRLLLDLFKEYDIAATWATVGMLFASSDNDAMTLSPSIRPEYADSGLSPYAEFARDGRPSDDFLYGQDTIEQIRATPRQEIGTHTFSHYYCCEPGQTKETFRADIESAVSAADAHGITLRSIVFPRNQHNPDYDDVLVENGIFCYRGNQAAKMYRFGAVGRESPVTRISRFADTYVNVSGMNTYSWDAIWRGPIANVAASAFLRPVRNASGPKEMLQFRRIAKCLDEAAEQGRIFHLWWHPHNFGARTAENISFLRKIFDRFAKLRADKGMTSFSMAETAERSKHFVAAKAA
ncbi:MAG TPA: polysaccharide deacetylase family protein [Pyrinomonadaceae bacterium]|nr:polysaccharide deacetylase family protein [Pyrinomonadaceae bacterium]